MEHLENDFERAEYLQNILISVATNGTADNKEYQSLRDHFLDNPNTKAYLPSWVRTNRDLSQYWQFIKFKFPTYAERRSFIWSEFFSLLEYLETRPNIPFEEQISDTLSSLEINSVHLIWQKALERRNTDPEGAITAARTLLETVCKLILDERSVSYKDSRIDLPELYHLVSTDLNLSPSQHTEEVFKQILGGCSAVVNGLSSIRNKLGDSHGRGKKSVRPAPRHAELAVNLSGSLALFLVETWKAQKAI